MADKVFILDENINIAEIQKTDQCFILAKNGIFYKDKQKYIESTAEVENISHLKVLKPYIKWRYPKINAKQFATILGFFRQVHKTYDTECMVMIGWHRKKEEIVIFPPADQQVTGASISYKNEKTPGIAIIGTIHSHNTMSAFHSPDDIKDEVGFEGLHITIGNLSENSNSFTISSQLTSISSRETIKYNKIIDGIEPRVKLETLYLNAGMYNNFINPISLTYSNNKSIIDLNYKLYPSHQLTNDMIKTITEWMTTVTKHKPQQFFNQNTRFTPLTKNNGYTGINTVPDKYDLDFMHYGFYDDIL